MSFQPAFFEVTAQLIPVVFLALLLEPALGRENRLFEGANGRIMRSITIISLLAAEATALTAVARGKPDRIDGVFISLMLILGVLFMLGPLFRSAVEEAPTAGEQWTHVALLAFALVAVAVIAFTGTSTT